MLAVGIMSVYLVVTIVIGWWGYQHTGSTPAEYFLAGQTLGRVVFPLTMFATLMSSYIFLGSAGFSYIHGFSWFAMIGVEVVAGIPLALVGWKAWKRAQAGNYITPTEFLGDAFESDMVKLLVVGVQFVWAVPYLAIQAMGGGILFHTISDGAIPFWAGALVITIVTGLYLSLGGLRGVAWSDMLQGVAIAALLVTGISYILPAIDPTTLTYELIDTGYLTPAGANDLFTPGIWISYLTMNALAVISYPQMFQRFFAAKDERAFRSLLVWWPVMAFVAALVPVLLGMWGSELIPGLADPDTVIPALLERFGPGWLVGIVMGGALAAMMSTADSLTLTLSSLITRDVYRAHVNPNASDQAEMWVGRATVGVLLMGGYLLALPQFGTIIELALYFIQGNALLLPVFLAALYWERASAGGALAAVVIGQGYFIAGTFGPAPGFGFLPFIPALVLATIALIVVSFLQVGNLTSSGANT